MTDFFYPQLDATTVEHMPLVIELARQDADYLLGAPYPSSLIATIRKLAQTPLTAINPEGSSRPTTAGEPIDLKAETEGLYRELVLHKPHSTDDTANMAYFRTRTSLLEKLIDMMTQAKNQKHMTEFISAVLEVIETNMTTESRVKVIDQLKALAK